MATSDLVDLSHGITIAFATSSFTAQITDITPPGPSRESIDVSHQGTVKWREFLPQDLVDNGEMNFTINFNPDTDPPIDGVAEVITITWPSANTWVFSGFFTEYSPEAPHLEKMTGSVTVKVTGVINITGPAGSQPA